MCALLGHLDALHATLQPSFFRPLSDEERAGPVARLLSDPAAAVLVAEGPGGPRDLRGVACVRLYDTRPDPSLQPARRALLDTLVVDPASRRRGVGRLLLVAAESWARARGAGAVLLTVWTGNADAERFYRACGYTTAHQVLSRELP